MPISRPSWYKPPKPKPPTARPGVFAPSWARGGTQPKPPTVNYKPPAGAPGAASAAPGGGGGAGVDYDINIPVDPIWAAGRLTAEKQLETTQAGVVGQRTRGINEYGFTETAADPVTGETGIGAFDPNNPFSKAALLKQTYDRSRRSSAQSMGSTGNLYSGAFQNQQDYVNRGQAGAEDTMLKGLQTFLAQNTLDKGQAKIDYLAANAAGDAARIDRLPSNPLWDPSASQNEATPVAPAAANKTGPIVTNKLGHKGRWVTRPDGTRYFQTV
jgi:hypothetical protein